MHISSYLLPLCVAVTLTAQGATPAHTRAVPGQALQLPGAQKLMLCSDGVEPAMTRKPVHRIEGVPAPNTRLGVLKTFDSSWTSSTDAGYYTVDAVDGTLHPVKLSDGMANILAAVKKGETMYCISLSSNMENAYISSLSTSTWNTVGARQEIDFVNVPSDLTIDPRTGIVYGFFYQETPYSIEYNNFASFNLTYAEASAIRTVEREVYACAADDNGLIYWLSSTQLGNISTDGLNYNYMFGPRVYPERRNTMTYDSESGLLYAFVTTDDLVAGVHKVYTTFYSINPVTRVVTPIRVFDNEQGYAGLFMLPTEIADTAPAQVSGVSFSFAGGNPPMGSVTMTAPTKNHIGGALTENVILIVEVNGEEHAIFDVAPGQRVTSPLWQFAEGEQTVTITAATSTERGEPLTLSVFAGRDVPAPPQGVTLTAEESRPHLSWQPVTMGAAGGEIDFSTLTYRVERVNDGLTVASGLTATEFDDYSYTPSGRAVSYRVYAVTADGESEPAESNRLAIGEEWQVPFTETFDTADDAAMWSIVDANGGATWHYAASSHAMNYRYDDDRLPGDDWLFSPALRLHAGAIYTLTYDYRVMLSSYPESFSVALGTSPSPQDMTETLATHNSVKNTKAETNSLTFTVPSDGLYHLGFHETSAPYMYILELDNVALRQLDNNVPAAPSALTVTPGERGALSARIEVTAPQTDADGGNLETLNALYVYRTDRAEPVCTFASPAPGQHLSGTDTSVPSDGSYTYVAYAVGEAGDGADIRTSLFVGTDVPDAVENLRLTEQQGHPVISWSAPVRGRNGGWFDPELLTYTVYRYFGEMEAVAEKITGTQATDLTLAVPSGQQMPVSYAVFPYAGGKAGRAIESNYILMGAPFAAPLTENFANADMRWYPWMSVTDEPLALAWTLDAAGRNPVASDWSDDQGLATFHSAGESATGVGSWFISPKISVASLQRPVVSFSVYHSTLADIRTPETLQLFASVEDGDYQPLTEVMPRDCGTTGWKRYTADISALPRDSWFRLAFKGVTAGGADMYLDAVTVEEGRLVDAAVAALSAPCRIAAGEEAEISATLENRGTVASDVEVSLAVDGTLIQTGSRRIGAGQRVEMNFAYSFTVGEHNVSVTVAAADDDNADNDVMTALTIAVEPLLPPATALAALAHDDHVSLSWTAADAYGAVADDFESYDDWAIEGIGDWIMTDRDYDNTVYINAGAVIPGAMSEYPHCTAPKSWQILNASLLGIDIWPEGTPHSGAKMLMASAGVNYVNSDWAISPLLNRQAQVVSFHAKAFTADGVPAERMRVLWSATGTAPECFTPLHDAPYIEVGDSWTEYRYQLPEGARYFAIECVSDGAFALFVDDVRYNDATVPRLTLTGYRIVRDGETLAMVAPGVTTYDDRSAPAGDVTYTVSAVYDKGVSHPTEPVTVTSTDLDTTEGEMVAVSVRDRVITVYGATGREITLCAPDGSVLRNLRGTDAVRIRVDAPGVYLLTIAGDTRKINVR